MTLPFVPLPLEDEQMISSALSDIDDPRLHAELQRQFTRRLLPKAQMDALRRRRFREALQEARDGNHPNPGFIAALEADKAVQMAQYEQRLGAILRRASTRTGKAADRVQVRREKAAKSANPTMRRFKERDRQYLEIIGNAERRGAALGDPLVVSEINSKIGRFTPPHWEKTTATMKVLAASVASAREGAQTINLRLTPEVQAAALASPRGTASYMQDRIRRELVKEFGQEGAPEFWIVVETDGGSRFHLHGAVVTPRTDDASRRVDDALRRAGGAWSTRQDKQQVSRAITDPVLWAAYVCKRVNLAGAKLGGKVFAMTRGMQLLSRSLWPTLRKELPSTS